MTEWKRELVTTADGSHTIYDPMTREHFHSIHGAIQESLVVFIENGLNAAVSRRPLKILELGWGSGLNTLLTSLYAVSAVDYHAIEKYPLTEQLIKALNYPLITGEPHAGFFLEMHRAAWDTPCQLSETFILTKINGDIQAVDELTGQGFHLVYFDAFSPGSQFYLWSEEIFVKLYKKMEAGGILVTYSSRGQVKRGLKAAGFQVKKMPGPPGKRDVLQAIKLPDLK